MFESVTQKPKDLSLGGPSGVQAALAINASEAAPTGFVVERIAGLPSLWVATHGDPDVMVAILDGPVDLSHGCFAGARIATSAAPAQPLTTATISRVAEGHGTHIASVIFAEHGSGVTGLAPGCRGVVAPVFHYREDGTLAPCSQIDLARAITQVVQLARLARARALVINISGGQFVESGEAHPILADVIQQCDQQRVLIVAAAGNQGCDCLHVPGAVPSVLVVGAMTADGAPLEFSNWGSVYRTQGILAPGQEIVGALPGGGVAARTGTSFATPIAAGVAALLLSWQIRCGQEPDAAQVRAALLRSAVGCDLAPTADCRRLLAGRLHVPGAMALLLKKGSISMSERIEVGEPGVTESNCSQEECSVRPAEQPSKVSEATAADSARRVSQPTDSMPLRSGGTAGLIAPSQLLDLDGVNPADCGCGGKKSAVAQAPQKVYAIGRLGFDYGTRQRREYFINRMSGGNPLGTVDPDSPANLIRYLTARPLPAPQRDAFGVPSFTAAGAPVIAPPAYTLLNGNQFAWRTDVTALIWTLKIDETPIYAIAPTGAFAFEAHDTLLTFLQSQLPLAPVAPAVPTPNTYYGDGVERIAVPGVIVGQTTLFTGETVPVISPFPGGLANWTTDALLAAIEQAIAAAGGGAPPPAAAASKVADVIDRMNEITRNLGVSSHDRALNYAATDALLLGGVLSDPNNQSRFAGLELDTIEVTKSPICRPDYDCWDAVITFYDPDDLRKARRGVRYTIDVSDVMPHIVSGSQRVFTLR